MSRTTVKTSHSEEQAISQLESIREMVASLHDSETGDDAREQIEQDPLSVEIRTDWHEIGSDPKDADKEYCILLCTGGPAVRIVGDLDHNEPSTARLEHQDWGTPWTEYRLSEEDEEMVLEYCRCFYFGE